MKFLIRLLILNICLFLLSCEKVIDVDLDTAVPRLVIDASIDWVKGTSGSEQKINLSTTTGYKDTKFPTVSGATIIVRNSVNNTIFNFIEGANAGEYACNNFIPVIGQNYTLTVTLNGTTYTATETLMSVPEIEPEITQTNTGGMTGDEMEIQFSFQDNGAEENYYAVGIKPSFMAFPEYDLESDENFQGKKMTQYYSHEDLKKDHTLNIKLYGVSKRFFDYFRKIILASGADTGPFPSTPAKVRGNIVNQTDANNYALGYFRLSEVSAKTYNVK